MRLKGFYVSDAIFRCFVVSLVKVLQSIIHLPVSLHQVADVPAHHILGR